MIDHVNYQVPTAIVHTIEMAAFWRMLGMVEVQPNEALDDQYVVRWWEDPTTGLRVHVVGAGKDALPVGLGHLCVTLPAAVWDICRTSRWLERHNPDSPMQRLWLRGPGGLRVEVQHA